MKSRIYLDEKVTNTDRRFGSAREYYPVLIVTGRRERAGFLTKREVSSILTRGENNPEDIPARTLWQRIKAWWLG